MNTDFRVAVDFFTHHKARKLKKRLGAPALLSLLQLWAYAAKLRTDGNLSGMSAEDIELAAEWDGDEGVFASALLDVGFLDQGEDGYCLHDWAENNPWVAEEKARSEQARKNAKARWNKNGKAKAQSGGNAPSDPEQCNGNAGAMQAQSGGNAPSPKPSPTPSCKEDSLRSPSSSELAGQASESAVPSPPASLDSVIGLPLNTGDEHQVTQGEVELWRDLYPAVDVMQELRNMKGWLMGNPKKRKTKSGIGRFIQAWLAKEQDNPRASPQPSARVSPSRNGNTMPDGRERMYESDFGALGADTGARP